MRWRSVPYCPAVCHLAQPIGLNRARRWGIGPKPKPPAVIGRFACADRVYRAYRRAPLRARQQKSRHPHLGTPRFPILRHRPRHHALYQPQKSELQVPATDSGCDVFGFLGASSTIYIAMLQQPRPWRRHRLDQNVLDGRPSRLPIKRVGVPPKLDAFQEGLEVP